MSKAVSKTRILKAAARIFAEKGYSGARVEEIARQARVTKALIYYYYKSKKAILRELLRTFFREATDRLLRFVERGGFAENPDENKRLFQSEYEKYLEENENLLRILLMESLKGDVKETLLFRLVDLEANEQDSRVKKIMEQANLPEKERQRMLVAEFFTGVIPFILYVVLKEKWCAHFKVSEKQLQEYFGYAMQETHEQYHARRKGSKW